MELTPQQIRTLEGLQSRKFEIVAFPMYGEYIGVRKGNCAALLAPVPAGGFKLFGEPSYLVAGNLGVRVAHSDGHYFTRKQDRIEATPERMAELDQFAADLSDALIPVA